MKKLLPVIFLVFISGCAEVNALRKSVGLYGADAADQALDTAIYTLCVGSTVGAIDRRFKTEEERAAYRSICPAP